MKFVIASFSVVSAIFLAGCGDLLPSPAEPSQNSPATAPKNEDNADSEPDNNSGSGISDSTKDVEPTKNVVFGDRFPEVLEAKANSMSGDKWIFDVTVSSTYDSPQRYADAWRVLDDQGNELGIRILAHDHAAEQPFTRSGVISIPNQTSPVFVEGRDQKNGWSGQRFEVSLPQQTP